MGCAGFLRGKESALVVGQPDFLRFRRMDQLFPEIRVSNGDERLGPLPAALSGEVHRAVLGSHEENLAAGRCYNIALKLRKNAGVAHAVPVREAGAHAEEGEPALRGRLRN